MKIAVLKIKSIQKSEKQKYISEINKNLKTKTIKKIKTVEKTVEKGHVCLITISSDSLLFCIRAVFYLCVHLSWVK